ncbi:MAG TPA: hypothetical protein VFP31_08535 [Gaiellaceae bacterium]|nr:hypothetical protein [Gaiellaceae bacterium]
MRRWALTLVIGLLLVEAPSASAYERPGELERVAAVFALRDAEVRCPSTDEWIGDPVWGGPTQPRAWGYTNMIREHIVMHPTLCAGATAVDDTTLPGWQRATGVLVLVHEAYHLRRWGGRWDEARVECRAIRHFRVGAELLGASTEVANDLLPYALAAHQRMVTLFPNYRDPSCKLPLWRMPISP